VIYTVTTPEAVMACTGALKAMVRGDYRTFIEILDANDEQDNAIMGALWEICAFSINANAEGLGITPDEALDNIRASFTAALIREGTENE
jgi:hypothetical protein